MGAGGALDAPTVDFVLGTILGFGSDCEPFATGLVSFRAALGGRIVVVVDMFEVGSTRSIELCCIALQLSAKVYESRADDRTARQLVKTSPVHRERQDDESEVSISVKMLMHAG